MVDVISDILIHRPKEVVAAFSADPDNATQWYANIKSVEWKTAKPLSSGSLITFMAQFLGRQLRYTYQITEWHPGHQLVMCTNEGPFPMETTYEWQAMDPNTTRMTLRNRGNPSGFSKIVTRFMAWAMKRANQKDLKRLKKILEEQ
jgi:ligand-binding SRPBCC domain-containing protein